MAESKIIECVVLDGHVIDNGDNTYEPGESVDLSKKEAARFVEKGIVRLLSDDDKESGRWKKTPPTEDEENAAALKAVADGNKTQSGKPTTEAMTEILGQPVSAAERDEIWSRVDEAKE